MTPVTMTCLNCSEESTPNARYCQNCGNPVGANSILFKEESIERRLIENDITERVAGRLIKWATWLGSCVAALVTITAALLAFFSLNLKDQVESVKSTAAVTKKDIISEAESVKKQYSQINSDLEHYRQVNTSINRLQKDLKTVRGQIDNWYKALETEIFTSSESGKVKFRALSPSEKKTSVVFAGTDWGFMAEVTLRKKPIPASVKVTRYNLLLAPNELTIDGYRVSFLTPSDKFERPNGGPISVQYHPEP
jgi:hypothetical protein